MEISELKKLIENIPDEYEVFIRCAINPCGNILSVDEVNVTKYGFFGTDVPCVIIEPEEYLRMK